MGHHAPSPPFFSRVSILSWKVCYMLTLFEILCVREGVTTPLCRQNQSLALLEFKQSVPVSAAVGKSLSSWRDGTDCCRWTGVSCDPTTGFVTSLKLSFSQLEVSELNPASLIKLHHLRLLDLSFNSISCVIPSRLSELTSLTYLDLSFCDFHGSIPKSFKQLSNLEYLDLGFNQLSREIPPCLLNHPTLQTLSLRYNTLNGSLPDFGSGFSVLREVDLDNNMLDGEIPSSIRNLPQLEVLRLKGNRFSGTFHLSLFQNMKNLSVLTLSSNELTVELPEAVDLGNEAAIFPLLDTLELRSCGIKGEFPLFLQSAKRLEVLDLRNNSLSGKIPTWLAGLPNLYLLDLSDNTFNGFDEIVNISAEAAIFPHLEMLELTSCRIKGEFPLFLQRAKRLSILGLRNNNMRGKIPTWLGDLPSLENLDLSENMFNGFDEITNLTNLWHLNLSSNQLQGQVPRGLVSIPNLNILDLKGNQLTGKITRFLHNCSGDLEFLDLSNNSFTGSLPNNWLTGFDYSCWT